MPEAKWLTQAGRAPRDERRIQAETLEVAEGRLDGAARFEGCFDEPADRGPVVAHEGTEDAQSEALDVVPREAVDPMDEVDDGADLGTGGIGEKGVEPEHGVLDLGGGERGEDLAGAAPEGFEDPGEARGFEQGEAEILARGRLGLRGLDVGVLEDDRGLRLSHRRSPRP